MWTNGSVAWRSMLALSAVVARTDTIVDSLNRLISVGGMLNHIESRGTVSLASADPHTAPLIDPNYLSDQVSDNLLNINNNRYCSAMWTS